MTGRDIDTPGRHAEVLSDLLARSGVGLVVNGWSSCSHQQSSCTFTPDIISLRPGNDSDVEEDVRVRTCHRVHATTAANGVVAGGVDGAERDRDHREV
jgi:hypothetical protein